MLKLQESKRFKASGTRADNNTAMASITIPHPRRRKEPVGVQLLLVLLPLLTLTGLAGAAFHLPHASLLLYWPAALVVGSVAIAFRPSPALERDSSH